MRDDDLRSRFDAIEQSVARLHDAVRLLAESDRELGEFQQEIVTMIGAVVVPRLAARDGSLRRPATDGLPSEPQRPTPASAGSSARGPIRSRDFSRKDGPS
jgi:hypothetical protein